MIDRDIDIQEYSGVIFFLHEYYEKKMTDAEKINLLSWPEGQNYTIRVDNRILDELGVEEDLKTFNRAALKMQSELIPDPDGGMMIHLLPGPDSSLLGIDAEILNAIAHFPLDGEPVLEQVHDDA